MLSFNRYINEVLSTEGANVGGLDYELKVYTAVKNCGVPGLSPGDKPTAGFSNQGSGDIEATYKGKPFNIEIKASAVDQMGGSSVRYDRETEEFELVKEMDPEDAELLLSSAKKKKDDINAYIDAARKIKPVELHKKINGVPLRMTKGARELLKQKGLSAKLNTNIISDAKFIAKHYNKKGVYYIQIGGSGLFYLGSNPLNLPVPELEGTIQIEMRIGFAGGDSTFTDKEGTVHDVRSAGIRLQGRLKTKGQSPYSLDDADSIKEMFKKVKKS